MNEQEPKKQTGWTIPSLVVLIIDVIGGFVLTTATLYISDKFLAIFKELNVPLPQITQLFLSIPTTVYLIIFFGVILALILKEIAIKSKPLTFSINMVALVIGVAYCFLYVIALFLPLIQIIQSVEKTN
jgi:hypothetical protein